jgi:hypothetical protein
MKVVVEEKVMRNLQSQSKFMEATQMTGRFCCTAIAQVLIKDSQVVVRLEGFGLLDGCKLTPTVVSNKLDKYQN